MLFDDGRYEELDAEVISIDPLEFTDSKPYAERLMQATDSSGLPEAIINGRGTVGDHPVVAAAMDMNFIGGSMGSAVGEKVTRLIERAMQEHSAVIIFSASGGARMQEGTLSLMQMAKISAALAALDEAHLPFISVLTDPTTGGVTASFARRAWPGAHALVEAYGADLGGTGSARRSTLAVHLCPARSRGRRRHREVRDAGRRPHRSARGTDRVRGTGRDRSDHPSETAERF